MGLEELLLFFLLRCFFLVGAGIHPDSEDFLDDLGELGEPYKYRRSSSTLDSAASRSFCNATFWNLSSATSACNARIVRLDSIIALSASIALESNRVGFAANKRPEKLARSCVCHCRLWSDRMLSSIARRLSR